MSESYDFTLLGLCREAWDIAEEAGWHSRPTGDIDRVMANLALIHSEVSEALETYRVSGNRTWTEVDGKPEGWLSELADVVIRVAELVNMTVSDATAFDQAVRQKMEYNRRRADVPARHGGKGI